jgi:hypothetical protein
MVRSRSPYPRRFTLRGTLGLCAGLAVTALGLSLASPAETSAESREESFTGRSIDPTVLRSRHVSVDVDQLTGLAPDDRLTFTLFDDVTFTAVVETTDGNGSRLGRIEGDTPGTFTLAVAGDGMAAIIRVPGLGSYRIRSNGDGPAVAEEIDPAAFPPCANGPEAHVGGGPAAEGGIASDDGSVIDLLVVYTPIARNGAGGTSALQSIINAAVANANNAYNRSNIDTQLNLVHTAEVDYDESGTYSEHLYRLTNPGDGYFDNAHDLRDEYNADMVALIVADNEYCGLAWLMQSLSPAFASSAFSVTSWFCAAGNLTLAHELGHNMGCAHDRDNSSNGLFSYSFGFQDTFEQFRTVMAYNCPSGCSRIQNFSNPDVLYAGRPTGVDIGEPDSAHNAQTINLSRTVIANFRQSVPPDCNGNGVPDDEDIAAGTSADCNGNGVPDSCDFAEQTSLDCNGNGIPDECDIDGQSSDDINGNGVPDECECFGDTNGNGEVGVEDFLQMLADWGPCSSCPADVDSNGVVDVSDFLDLLSRWGPCP